jgi:RNA polymerase sigma-70 factor (ECF subfamily)
MLIARRHLIDRLRRNAVRGTPGTFQPDAPDTQGGHRPEQRPQEDERNVSLMQRVAELPELQRVVIERAYLQGYTLREVSEQLEAPLGTVKSALSRGLARLRERAKADWAV